jgi:hypothetical protein|tara:strand:+ start:539 stop:1003 length:465 start_codon:yes stop_codon:yes gene_type:complete
MAMQQPGMGMMAPEGVAQQPTGQPMPQQPTGMQLNPQDFDMALQSLSPESMETLDRHLTPPVKKALSELFGAEAVALVQDIGPNEPTVNLPVSIVASAYPSDTIESSIELMAQDFASKGQQEIPSSPQGGLGGAPATPAEDPTTNVPPSMPMMA